jgi:hypothetical protein
MMEQISHNEFSAIIEDTTLGLSLTFAKATPILPSRFIGTSDVAANVRRAERAGISRCLSSDAGRR